MPWSDQEYQAVCTNNEKLRTALHEICNIDQLTIRRTLGPGEQPNQTSINLRRMGDIAKAALKE